jgi:predicted nucleotidyltransferase
LRADAVLAILRAHFPELQAMGIRSMALFGSVARGEAGPESDVDLLVEFEPPLGFDRYMDAKFRLEALLDRPVDLITTAGLKPELRPTIERECLRVP